MDPMHPADDHGCDHRIEKSSPFQFRAPARQSSVSLVWRRLPVSPTAGVDWSHYHRIELLAVREGFMQNLPLNHPSLPAAVAQTQTLHGVVRDYVRTRRLTDEERHALAGELHERGRAWLKIGECAISERPVTYPMIDRFEGLVREHQMNVHAQVMNALSDIEKRQLKRDLVRYFSFELEAAKMNQEQAPGPMLKQYFHRLMVNTIELA